MNKKNSSIITALASILALFTIGCSAQQTESQALESLRQMTRDGKLPPEGVVANIESRFAGKRTGALARLIRARIRFENKDLAGAADALNSDVFSKQTKLGDYALWLRGRAMQQIGNHKEAQAVFERLFTEFRDSLHANEARILWAASASNTGDSLKVPGVLSELIEAHHAGALLATARAYDTLGDLPNATVYYRRTYFYGAGGNEAKQAEVKLTAMGQALVPQNAEEIIARAEGLFNAKDFAEAETAFASLAANFPSATTSATNLMRMQALANLKRMPDAQSVFNRIPQTAPEKERAYYDLVIAYARNRGWADARRLAEEMRRQFPTGQFTVKAWVDAGMAARDLKTKAEEQYFLSTALANYPNAVEVASAQFELAWLAHEARDFDRASQMLIEHLARYVDKDTSNRGRAGYWAARNSERAGKTNDACILYDSMIYRYSANWYGYQAQQRLDAMRSQGKCGGRTGDGITALPTSHSMLAKAAANLRTVTVAPETAGLSESLRAEKSIELSTIGLFDWSINELNEARKTAPASPSINLALARHYRNKNDNVNALLALARSYPDYSQMFPEEMGREEWDIFYPHIAWDQIATWSKHRNLDIYNVAGLIRQESVFNPRARSSANAYGLMQLLIPTAQITARKFGANATINAESLFQPALNIELGTAYMREQLDRFGRIEYMAVAYNAGPGRVPQWRAQLPIEMDEFVEAIPFRETRGYVQGIIRNSAQYRRLYDESGAFRSNVGTRPLRAEIDTKTREQVAALFPDLVISE
ncbi:MAG TPA: transglycosylase SLT domain-containing protein [Pyrinomonadaceae bacterium]|nr:transglycosylase SLT domain-containing protein [Pyrinomonadaceae bacterium]